MSAEAHAPLPHGRPVRVARLPVTSDQDHWLRTVCAAALAEGTRLSEATILRLALDRLRGGSTGWPELRTTILTESKRRSRRG